MTNNKRYDEIIKILKDDYGWSDLSNLKYVEKELISDTISASIDYINENN